MNETNIKETKCPHCGRKITGYTLISGSPKGDLPAVCLYCGCVHIISPDGILRLPTADELPSIRNNPAIAQTQCEVRQKHLMN